MPTPTGTKSLVPFVVPFCPGQSIKFESGGELPGRLHVSLRHAAVLQHVAKGQYGSVIVVAPRGLCHRRRGGEDGVCHRAIRVLSES